MSFELISKEKNVAKVKLTIPQDAFEEGIKKAYGKNRSKFNIPGVRKGKAPLNIIENRYGKEIFYEDALDEAFPEVYGECIKEGEFKAVAAPVLISVDKLDAEGAVVLTVVGDKDRHGSAALPGLIGMGHVVDNLSCECTKAVYIKRWGKARKT